MCFCFEECASYGRKYEWEGANRFQSIISAHYGGRDYFWFSVSPPSLPDRVMFMIDILRFPNLPDVSCRFQLLSCFLLLCSLMPLHYRVIVWAALFVKKGGVND